MALVIPNIENITNGSTGLDFQTVQDETDLQALAMAASSQAYVVWGMAVTQDTGSDMKVAVAAGAYVINGAQFTYAGTGGTPLTITAASATDRRDIIEIDTSGTVYDTTGTACGTAGWVRSTSALPPVKPPVTTNRCILGEVGVTSSTTVITTAINIVDKTVMQTQALGAVIGSAVSTSTNVAVSISGLSFAIAANQVMQFRGHAMVVASTTTTTSGGSLFAITAPTGATGYYAVRGTVASAATTVCETATTTIGTLVGPFAESTVQKMVSFQGTIINAATPGLVTVQYASGTTAHTVTVETGASIVAIPV